MNRCRKLATSLVLSSSLIVVVGAQINVIYVDDDSTGGNGTTWGTAFPTLEQGLNDVNPTEETVILIAEGTYTPPGASEFPGLTDSKLRHSKQL